MSEHSELNREEELFEKALQLESHAERLGFLKGACSNDPDLFTKLVDLIEAHQGDENFIQTVDGFDPIAPDTSPLSEGPGTAIGRYKLLESLGEGGFGVVWAAEQKEPVKRRVALKIIKLGMDTRKVVARFEAERQALALMDHPNIARVFDAGSTDGGRPYFVMELVKGIPITHYCEQENLAVNDRLILFTKVCRAIQHAHQKGIIHRDIKPSNVLVTLHDGEPVPKVIDFGIAKATQQELTEKTIYTQFNQFIGTPAYMSPEQAELSGLDIDTRSDIYSLGVLLYEMLTRSTPFDSAELMKAGLDEMRKTIREREPVRPSTRLSEITQARSANDQPKSPQPHPEKTIEPDIDWIVMKCLEKDRSRRYDTANGLALDVKRHLENEPVIARPPSLSYRLQKSWRRNRTAIAACLTVTAALVIGLTIAVWQAIEANRAKARELERSREAQTARQIAEENATLAVRERDRALAAENEATRLQAEAETKAKEEYRRAYAADMNRAYREIGLNKLGSALKLLNRYKPQPDEEDIRGWEWRYLRQFCQSDALYRLPGKDTRTGILSVSNDGKYFSGISTDGPFLQSINTNGNPTLPPWTRSLTGNVLFAENHPFAFSLQATGEESRLMSLNMETGRIVGDHTFGYNLNPLRLSEDSQTLGVFDGPNESVHLIRLEDHQVVHSLSIKRYGRRILPLELSPNMKMLALIDSDDLSRFGIVTLETGKMQWWPRTASHSDYLKFEFSPDSKTIASCAGFVGSEVHVWSTATAELLFELPGYQRWVRDFEFLDDGTALATAGADGSIRIWDLTTQTLQQTLIGHKEEVISIKSIENGSMLLSSGFDGEILVWDRNHTIQRDPYVIINHRPPTYHLLQSRWWGFSKQGQVAITLDQKRQLARWSPPNFDKPERLAEFPPDVIDFILSDGGELAVTFDSSDRIVQWDLQDLSPQSKLLRRQPGTVLIAASAASNRLVNLRLIDETKELELQVIDLESNEITGSHTFGPTSNTANEIRVILASAAISQDGNWLAMPVHAKRKILVNLNHSPLEITDLENPATELRTLAISPDNRWVAACGEPHLVTLHEIPSGKRLFELTGQMSGAKSTAFSNDSARVVTVAGGNESLTVWDLKNHQDLITIPGQGSFWTPAQFSSDGNHIGALNSSGQLHIWSAPSWDQIHAMEAAED